MKSFSANLFIWVFGLLFLAGCASFATPVGTLAHPEDAATIVGYARYYMVHSSYGKINRVDSTWLSNSNYAVKVAPGPHLLTIRMTQVSALNPLMFSGGGCAIIFDFAPRKKYQIEAPSFGVYRHFWLHPDIPGLPRPKRFSASISVAVSGDGMNKQHLELPMDCSIESVYCRVAADCVGSGWRKPDPSETVQDNESPQCRYEEGFSVGTCSAVVPAPILSQ
jgi:hypothetical protein